MFLYPWWQKYLNFFLYSKSIQKQYLHTKYLNTTNSEINFLHCEKLFSFATPKISTSIHKVFARKLTFRT